MRKPVFSFFILLLLFIGSEQAVRANSFFIDLELDFFNRGINIFRTETFKRYHQVDLNYYFNDDFNLGVTYNWCDHVTSNVSTHKITPWQLTLVKDTYRFDAVLISDLINKKKSSTYYLGTFPSGTLGKDQRYAFDLKLGIRFHPQHLALNLGGMIRKGDFWLGINLLNPIDARLRDEADGKNNIPITIGYRWRPHPYSTISFEFNRFLLPSDTEINSWSKIGLNFRLFQRPI